MIIVQLIEVQFLAHSLQIHCFGLFGPLSISFGLWEQNVPLQLAPFMENLNILKFITQLW